MHILIIVIALAAVVGVGTFLLFKTEAGHHVRRKMSGGSKEKHMTDLQAADSISTAEDVGAVAPGVARDPFSVVLGYYIDSRTAQRVRREPERNGQLVSTEPNLPTLIFGPPGSGKTTSLLEPAILTFGLGKSPVLAGSVKHDLAQATIKLRSRLGTASIFDPTGQTPAELRKYLAMWTPLSSARTWRGAVETSGAMVFASTDSGPAGDSFWSTQAVSLLSVLMFYVASKPGTSMQEVSRLLGDLLVENSPEDEKDDASTPSDGKQSPQQATQQRQSSDSEAKGLPAIEKEFQTRIRELSGSLEELRTAASEGTMSPSESTRKITDLEARIDEFEAATESLVPFISIARTAPPTIGGILASCSNVLAVYRFARRYARVKWDDPDLIDIDQFLHGANTIYLCAPPREQQLYAPLLSAFAQSVIARAYEIGQSSSSGKLPHGLLMAIDELSAMPLDDMASIFATARSYALNLLVSTQDASQLVAKYGEHATNSLISSAAAVCVLPRTKDVFTIQTMSTIAGEVRVKEESRTTGKSTNKSKGEAKEKSAGESESVTHSYTYRPLLPAGKIATFAPREAFAIVGSQRCQLLLRPFYDTEILKRLADGDISALREENSYQNVKANMPAQPGDKLADLNEPLPPDEEDGRRRYRRPQDDHRVEPDMRQSSPS